MVKGLYSRQEAQMKASEITELGAEQLTELAEL